MDEKDLPDPRTRGSAAPQGSPIVAGRYRVDRLIARGGMAAVFLAEHIALRRPVALKILHAPPDAEETGNFEKRFRLEAETLAGLDHPNIVTLHDYGQAEDGRFFLAMEYIEGPRFTDLLSAGALSPDRTIQLLLQVCAALRYAHKRGVIHRDLKPSNLLIRTDAEGNERVKVVDFGLVKVSEIDQSLTREGLVLGSPHCMAPEQVRGSDIDHRADIYAIGVLLFRSLTGSYPFHGATSTATMVSHLNDPVPTFASVAPELRVPARLEEVVRKCLAKKQADRYPDVNSLMEDLSACIGAPVEPDTTQSLSIAEEPTAEAPRRSRAPLLLLAALLLLLVVGGGAVTAYVATRGSGTEGTVPPVSVGTSTGGVPVTTTDPAQTPKDSTSAGNNGTGTTDPVPAVDGTTPPPTDPATKDPGTKATGTTTPPSKRPKDVRPNGTGTPHENPVKDPPASGTNGEPPPGYMGLPDFEKDK